MRFRFLPACVLCVAALCATDHGERWWGHISRLAGDSLTGRSPGTEGHRKAAQYVAAELEKAGVSPAGKDGYLQPVKLRSRRILEQYSSLALVRGGAAQPLVLGDDAVVSLGVDPAPAVEAPLVFVGYGLTIPEMHYDDLAGLELHGKIAVIMSGGPSNIPGALRARCQSDDERHKLLRQHAGVFGIVTIQNPKKMDVPWAHVASHRLDAAMSVADPAFEQDDELELSVAINPDRADKLFEGSGHTFKELLALADAGKPLPRFAIPASLRARIAIERIEGESQNVVGVLPGSDPKLKNEYVVLTADLDHRGIPEPRDGERTGAEALDDGSAVASLLDVAGALHESHATLRRSLMFVFLTGEEKGLFGSIYFAQYPPVDAARMVAQLKVDQLAPLTSLRSITVYGLAESDLGAQARAVGARMGVRIQADPVPQWEIPIRSDQYSLIRRGVPALSFMAGLEDGSKDEHTAEMRMKERYRPPLDGVNQAADKSCASRFDQVVLEVAKGVANRTERPRWLATSYFKTFGR